MKLMIFTTTMVAAVAGSPIRRNFRQLAEDETWTTTERCNCYEYLTDPIFRNDQYNFDKNNHKSHHRDDNNDGYFNMAEFCCEFAAELADPTCEKEGSKWVNREGEPPNAPKEALVCDILDEPSLVRKNELKQQARNACFCFYRDIGCGRSELEKGGYCDYPNSEVTLDDFRMANNSAHNMCNACLGRDLDGNYEFPIHYEGLPHGQCVGYCLLKRGDPNDVYKPTVSDKQCCFEEEGFGFDMNGYETNQVEKEIIYMPFQTMNNREYDYFFNANLENLTDFDPKQYYGVTVSYNGLCTAFISIERHGDASAEYPPSLFNTSEFDIKCEPGDWDSLSINVYDEISDGGIAFKDVTMDGVELGDFGFGVQVNPECSDQVITADTVGVHGHNRTCISRPGGFGHMAGFELKGQVELSGFFQGDGIGLELIIGCKKKEEEKCGCSDGTLSPKIKGSAVPWHKRVFPWHKKGGYESSW